MKIMVGEIDAIKRRNLHGWVLQPLFRVILHLYLSIQKTKEKWRCPFLFLPPLVFIGTAATTILSNSRSGNLVIMIFYLLLPLFRSTYIFIVIFWWHRKIVKSCRSTNILGIPIFGTLWFDQVPSVILNS